MLNSIFYSSLTGFLFWSCFTSGCISQWGTVGGNWIMFSAPSIVWKHPNVVWNAGVSQGWSPSVPNPLLIHQLTPEGRTHLTSYSSRLPPVSTHVRQSDARNMSRLTGCVNNVDEPWYVIFCLHHSKVSAKALCFRAVCLLYVHLFIRTDLVTMISQERLEQSRWNLQGIFAISNWWHDYILKVKGGRSSSQQALRWRGHPRQPGVSKFIL